MPRGGGGGGGYSNSYSNNQGSNYGRYDGNSGYVILKTFYV